MAASGAAVAFANMATLSVGGTPLAVIKDVEVTLSAEHVPLYGWGSILRQGIAKHSFKVGVKVGYCKFDPGIGSFPLSIFTTAGAVNDTNAVVVYSIVGVFNFLDNTTGTQLIRMTITDVYFPEMPLKASEGQWIRLDLAGEGSTVAIANT